MKATIHPPRSPQIRLLPAPAPDPEPSATALCLTTDRHQVIIEPWPARAWRRPREGGRWHEFTPHIDLDYMARYSSSFDQRPKQLQLPFGQARDHLTPAARASSYDRFRAAIPEWARELVGGLQTRQLDLLRFLGTGRPARELAEANLALAFLTAATVEAPMWDEVIALKQRDLVDLLDFPPEQRSVRVLRKLTLASITMPRLERLRCALWNPETAKLFAHCRRIPPSILLGLTYAHTRKVVSPSLLRDVASDARIDDARFARNLEQILSIADEWGVARRVGRPRSLAHLMRNVGSLHLLQDLSHLGSPRSVVFPPPPVAGVPGIIEPITSPQELAIEAATQHNCVVNMADEVVKRQKYFYRLREPQRATICLEVGTCGWELLDTKLVNNDEPEASSHVVVWSWVLGSYTRNPVDILDPGAARAHIVECLDDPEARVRAGALKALKEGGLMNADVVGRVVELLQDPAREVREAAVDSFDGAEVAVVKTVVVRLAQVARSIGVADEAHGLLTILGGMAHECEAAMEVVRWAFEHASSDMRYAAISSLDSSAKDRRLVPLVLGALTDCDENVRRTAGGLLETFANHADAVGEDFQRLGQNGRRRRRGRRRR